MLKNYVSRGKKSEFRSICERWFARTEIRKTFGKTVLGSKFQKELIKQDSLLNLFPLDTWLLYGVSISEAHGNKYIFLANSLKQLGQAIDQM